MLHDYHVVVYKRLVQRRRPIWSPSIWRALIGHIRNRVVHHRILWWVHSSVILRILLDLFESLIRLISWLLRFLVLTLIVLSLALVLFEQLARRWDHEYRLMAELLDFLRLLLCLFLEVQLLRSEVILMALCRHGLLQRGGSRLCFRENETGRLFPS